MGAPEINQPNNPRAPLIVGRDYGEEEERCGRPFVGVAGRVLEDCLREAGWRRTDVNITNVVNKRPPGNRWDAHNPADVEEGIAALRELVCRLKPNIVVALGNEASWALVPEYEDPHGIEEKRGYLWAGICRRKVLTTVHPALVARQWIPWRPLLDMDLQHAREEAEFEELRRPEREVQVVGSEAEAQEALEWLRGAGRVACDLENKGDELACVGFAASGNHAVVFPAEYLRQAGQLLEDPALKKIFHNGMYDTYFLRSRCGIHVAGYADDTIVQWHSLYPELAGAAQGRKAKRTHKSLNFLASLYLNDAFWKDYQFAEEGERYILNGKDCCVTFDLDILLQRELDAAGVRRIYNHTMRLVPAVVDMFERGVLLHDTLRRERMRLLDDLILTGKKELEEIVLPLIQREEKLPMKHLFCERKVCPCCRNGKVKRSACWQCAGYEKKPGKGVELGPCRVCNGEGASVEWNFNPASTQQRQVLLYNVLKLPKKFREDRLTTDEEALKKLLREVKQ